MYSSSLYDWRRPNSLFVQLSCFLLFFHGERRIMLVTGFGVGGIGLEHVISPVLLLDAPATGASSVGGAAVCLLQHTATSLLDNACSTSSMTVAALSSSSSSSSSPSSSSFSLATTSTGAAYYSYYTHALATHPLVTKMATGAVLAVVGDAIAQRCMSIGDSRPLGYDVKRATAFCLFDVSYRAVQHYLYPPLIQHFQGQYVMATMAAIGTLLRQPEMVGVSSSTALSQLSGAMEQALVSQLAIIPTLYYPVFFIVTGAVQGLTMEQTMKRAQETFIPLMKRNLLFWIPVVCNYCIVSWHFQSYYMSDGSGTQFLSLRLVF
jgi:hypothetical protein